MLFARLFLLLLGLYVARAVAVFHAPVNLRVEGLADYDMPVVSEPNPRFSFVHFAEDGASRGVVQRSYRITVTKCSSYDSSLCYGDKIFWDSTQVNSSACSGIAYKGLDLEAFQRYVWTAEWTAQGSVEASEIATSVFETGPMNEADWFNAKWLTGDKNNHQFRFNFTLPSTPIWARAYVVAPGCHHLEANGQIPAPDLRGICPWPVDGSKNVRYMTHDITNACTKGNNALGLLAGAVMTGTQNVLAVFVFRLKGWSDVVVTSGTKGWMQRPSYVTSGTAWQSYIDWRLHESHWSQPEPIYSPSAEWMPATTSPAANGVPRALGMPLSAVLNEVGAVSVERMPLGGWLYTFPKNFVGTVKVAPLPNAADGATLDILAGEWLVNAGSAPDTTPKRCAVVEEGEHAYLGGCAAGHAISSVSFASFGTPSGDCGHGFMVNSCNSNESFTKINALCLGKASCTAFASVNTFDGKDPCNLVKKKLAVIVRCDNDPQGPPVTPAPTPAPPPSPPSVPQISGGRQQIENHVLRAGNNAPLETLFCWHGFQYVLVTASENSSFKGRLEDIVGLEIHTNISSTGSLGFGGGGVVGDLYNGLQAMTLNSQVTNVAAYMPTDCPTREKHGWMGDALDSSEEAMYNFDMRAVFEVFMQLIADNQGPTGDVPSVVPNGIPGPGSCNDIAWTSVFPQLASFLHLYYGDTRVLDRFWEPLTKYTENLVSHAATSPNDLAVCDQFQDWLCGQKMSCCSNSPAGTLCPVKSEMAGFNYVLALKAMSNMASVLGKTAAASRYASLGANATMAFHTAFYNEHAGAYGGDAGAVQSLTLPALAIGSAPSATIADAQVRRLVEDIADPGLGQQPYTLRVGAVTSKILLNVLSENGQHETALKMASQTAEPSWGFWWENNATTCWENWPGSGGFPDPNWQPGESSGTRNHIFLCGGLGEWYWKHLAGITPTSAGFATVRVAPKVRLMLGPQSLKAAFQSVRGVIVSDWKLAEGGKRFELDVVLPTGVQSAVVAVHRPFDDANTGSFVFASTVVVTESGVPVWDGHKLVGKPEGITAARETADGIEFDLSNGAFSFVATTTANADRLVMAA